MALFIYNFIFAAQQVDLFIVQPVKIELINAKETPLFSFPNVDSSKIDVAGDGNTDDRLLRRSVHRLVILFGFLFNVK